MPYLVVKNRDKTVFEGEVDTISCYNKKGTFDILPEHANFISIIEKTLLIRQKGSTKEIEAQNGLIKVKENKIYIYLGIK